MRQIQVGASPRQAQVRQLLAHVVPGLSLLVLGSCAHKVVSFSVEPPQACPGEMVNVQWQVQGPASLRTEHEASDASEETVPSTGARKVTVTQRTSFTIRALDANPAEGRSFGTQVVDVPHGPTEMATASTCDAFSAKCTGSFELPAADRALVVRSIAMPRIVRAGQAQPGKICVSHPGMPTACIADDGKVDVAVAAAGVWTLEADLLPTEVASPGPRLQVQLGFGCP